MIYIEHRKNQKELLAKVPSQHGVEMDLRSLITEPGSLLVTHDAFSQGDDFRAWAQEFKRAGLQGPLVLNTKEDQLEETIFSVLAQEGLEQYLFLDTAFPTFIKYWQRGLGHRFMLRMSKYETFSNLEMFKGSVQWVWVDCFHGEALDISLVERAARDFKLCLVSPELQGHSLESKVKEFLPLAPLMSAICTKNPNFWMQQGVR